MADTRRDATNDSRTDTKRDTKRETKNAPGDPQPWRVEGQRAGAPKTPGGSGGKVPQSWMKYRRYIWIALILLLLNRFLAASFIPQPSRIKVPYTTFREQIDAGNITDISSKADAIQGTFKASVTVDGKSGIKFSTERPPFADDGLLQRLVDKGVVVNAKNPDEGTGFLATMLYSFGPTLLLVGLFVFMARKASAGGGLGGIGGLGKSRAQRYDEDGKRTTFDDVAGIEDAEQELVEIVDFLKNPGKYRELGATIPKGVLLSGPPGTGKTLLARAVAGEANVPFFHMSASEFIEMIVGVGASRVRDLFATAKANAPAIIFIDEIDTIGRSRGGSSSMGGHDEREQTLNQILTEMDGFSGSEGVIVLAATNRPEILDAALLRPGRFDRRVVVSPPDQVGREEILKVHSKSVPLAPDVSLGTIASTTPGMVGADLKNLVNEAALLAARRGHKQVQRADFSDSLEKIILGTERRLVMSPAEKERTAFHESGHALLGMLQPGADPVRKISIVPRGQALGVTLQSPESDRYSYDADYLRGRIIGALGGRAAEHVVYGNVTTGAESDLDTVTRIARQMVGRWGMSEAIGPLTVLPRPDDGSVLFGESPDAPSAKTRELVDSEVRRIVEDCYEHALSKLRENRDKLDALAHALLAKETLDEKEAYEVAGVEHTTRAGIV